MIVASALRYQSLSCNQMSARDRPLTVIGVACDTRAEQVGTICDLLRRLQARCALGENHPFFWGAAVVLAVIGIYAFLIFRDQASHVRIWHSDDAGATTESILHSVMMKGFRKIAIRLLCGMVLPSFGEAAPWLS